MRAIGLMSGTSLDGIDAALVDVRPGESGYAVELVRFGTTPFQPDLERALRAALPPNPGSVEALARLHHALGEALGKAALSIAEGERVDFVASHGQTLFHDGERSVTLQVGDAFVVREIAGATVCYDFRSADCAAGGHGAPLVPYVDALLFHDASETRAAVNIGGIANATILPRDGEIVAFDTGPGNMLIDALVSARTGGNLRFDRDGALAARGSVDERLLNAMLQDPYFSVSAPKTTGRERFGAQFLRAHAALDALSLEDAAATLTELTAATVAGALAAEPGVSLVIVSGGGASNATLMKRLQGRLQHARVERSDAMGVSSEAKEAIAFAVLGYETLRGRAANVPRATGARRAVVMGAIAPRELGALLAKVARECGE